MRRLVVDKSKYSLFPCDTQFFDQHAVDFDLPPRQLGHFMNTASTLLPSGSSRNAA